MRRARVLTPRAAAPVTGRGAAARPAAVVTAADDGRETSPKDAAEAESGSSSEEDRRRGRCRVRRFGKTATLTSRGGRTFLEEQSVAATTLQRYRSAVERFLMSDAARGVKPELDESVDDALARYFTDAFFSGKHPTLGEQTAAGLMALWPEFSMSGGRRIPRAWRALKGWRRLTPMVSRKPLPWPLWAAVAHRLCRRGQRAMAIYVLMTVSCYCRPGELLSLRRCDLVAPAPGVYAAWSLLLFPEEERKASKTHMFNDSLPLDDERIAFLAPAWRAIACPTSTAKVWGFTYPAFAEEFKKCVTEIGLPDVVPYQMRHSGPSTDLADGRRTSEQAQRRGRWAAARSMARYERSARLTAEWAKVPERTRAHCEDCVPRLADAILGPAAARSSGCATRG